MREIYERWIQIFAENPILSHILDTCLTVSIIIVFLLLIRPLMKRLPRIGMYVLWIMVAVRILCPITINGIYGLLPEQVEQSMAEKSSRMKVESIANRQREMAMAEYTGREESYRLPNQSHGENSQEPFELTTEKSKTIKDKNISASQVKEQMNSSEKTQEDYIILAWGIGVLICWLYMLVSLLITKYKYADAKLLEKNVYTHPLVGSSFVGGIFLPKIYLPEGVSDVDKSCILCHERVHIRRRDYLVKPMIFIIFSLLWFNPLIWVAYCYLVKDMEISCDEAVLSKLGSEAKEQYSYLLLAMASGNKGRFSQNPTFSSGTIKERIVSVMGYKKPTAVMTALVVAVVALCSCGIASAPEETAKPVAVQSEKIYVEQVLDCFATSIYGEGKVDYNLPKMNLSGEMVDLPDIYKSQQSEDYDTKKVKVVNGQWREEEADWLEKFNTMFDQNKKASYITDYQYAEDGYLYLTVSECTMSVADYEKQADEDEGFAGMVVESIYLLKVDEKAGAITEIEVPAESKADVYKARTGEEMEDKELYQGLAENQITVFPNGNLFINNGGNICGIYSQATGEQLVKVDNANTYIFSKVMTGDDFFCVGVANLQEKRLEVRVYDTNGEVINTIPIDVEVSEESLKEDGMFVGVALSVKENTIVLATAKGIFEAEADAKEFTQIVDAEKDNLYYLSEDYDIAPDALFKGEKEDYYLVMYKGTAGGGDDYYLCHYTPKV